MSDIPTPLTGAGGGSVGHPADAHPIPPSAPNVHRLGPRGRDLPDPDDGPEAA
jgi:hypothetical protein